MTGIFQTPSQTPLSWCEAAAELARDGITTAPVCYAAEADYLREAYIEKSCTPQAPPEAIAHVSRERAARVGNAAWLYVSFTDPVLAGLLLQPDLIGLIGGYYGHQPYFRRMAFLKRTALAPHHELDISGVYHIDQGRHFVGVMMLLADLTEGQSHMRFLKGTHRIEQRDFRLKPNDPRNRELDEALEREHPVRPLVGPKGTMFIYDNGNGIHKGNMIPGTTRDVMQATFSRGDHESKPADRELLPAALRAMTADAADPIREAIKYVI